ncbi:hypothetical protein L2E82_08146 [Cichorium intybus]|uniref:Uncharacterized protein n=1 Tax=Cichorium intybus TaxID=13427 RepID=A0ACB9G5S1_CICIN|nr:hypothetical protein L2E82_08146 [Cichorium intybus]
MHLNTLHSIRNYNLAFVVFPSFFLFCLLFCRSKNLLVWLPLICFLCLFKITDKNTVNVLIFVVSFLHASVFLINF